MFISETKKAELFDKIIARLKQPGNFEQISNTGYGYFKLHVWCASQNEDVIAAIMNELAAKQQGAIKDDYP